MAITNQNFHELMACNIDLFVLLLSCFNFSLRNFCVLVRTKVSHLLGSIFVVHYLELTGQESPFLFLRYLLSLLKI